MHSFPNRSICSILDDLRKAHETRNYSYLTGIIEELQWAGNRMEASLGDIQDINQWKKERTKLRHEITKLEHKKDSLEEKE